MVSGQSRRRSERSRGCWRRNVYSSALVCLLFTLAAAHAARAQEKEKDLDKVLALSLTDLLNLRVETVLKQPGTINQVPATVRVITADQIQERGYFTLEDALADLPGFQFRNIQGFNSYVFLRGAPSQNNKILVLVDGIQINELNSGGFYAGGQFNLASVQQIEVAYGPASCLYGTNAVSGVVNLITRAPESSKGGQIGLLAGNFDTHSVDFRYGTHAPDGRLGFTLSGMYKHSDKSDLRGSKGDGNWTDNLDNFETDASFDGRVRAGDFTLGFNVQDKDTSYATAQRTADAPLSDHGVNWHIQFLNGWATYTYDKKKAWSLRSTAYYRNTTVPRDTIPIIELPTADSPGRQFRWYRPGHLIGDETRLHWTPALRWSFSLGLVLERERLSETFSITESSSANERPPAPPDPSALTNELLSLYAQAQIPLSKTLDLFAGLRHDDSSYYGTVDTPRLGLVFNRGKLTARVLYMDAFRAPKPWDFTNGVGNPDLKPETMRSYEISGAWSFSQHLRLDVSAFHNHLHGLLTRTGQADWRWINAGELNTDGLEIVLEHRRGALKTFVTYSYTDSRDERGGRVPEIALHGATAGVAYAVSRAFVADLRCRYLGDRINPAIIPATGNNRIGDALVLNTTSSLMLPWGLRLRLSIDNLTNVAYYHPSNLPPSRYRQPERSFRLKVEYAF
jgi:outer membrane receptor for ferrienterochelin and colicins